MPPRKHQHASLWRQVDICNSEALAEAVRQFSPEVVLHFGARTDLEGRRIGDYEANIKGVEALIASLSVLPALKRVVFASSRLVCRIGYQPLHEADYCPSTPYGESKVIGEQLVRSRTASIPAPWLIVRPTSIWGPWFEEPYKTFFMSVIKGRYVHPGKEPIYKSFGYVGNTVHQIQRLLEAPAADVSERTFYLADYPPIEVGRLAEAIQQAAGTARIRRVPPGVLRLAAGVGDVLKYLGMQNPPLTSFRLDNLLTPMVHDLESLSRIVGDLPYSMEEGVRHTVDWLRSRGEIR